MSLDRTIHRFEAKIMMQTLFLFLAPGTAADRDAAHVGEAREPQAQSVSRSSGTTKWRAAAAGSMRVAGDALGLVALIAVCWLTLPLMALLFP